MNMTTLLAKLRGLGRIRRYTLTHFKILLVLARNDIWRMFINTLLDWAWGLDLRSRILSHMLHVVPPSLTTHQVFSGRLPRIGIMTIQPQWRLCRHGD